MMDVKSGTNIFIPNTALVNLIQILKKKENIGLFLIGGPSKHYYWDSKIVLEANIKIFKKV